MKYHLKSVCIAQAVNQALQAMAYYKVVCYPSDKADVIHIHMGDAAPFVAVDARKFAAWFARKKPFYHELKSMIEAKHQKNINK